MSSRCRGFIALTLGSAAVLAAILMPQSAVAMEPTTVPSQGDGFHLDSQWYAEHFEVSLQEASARLNRQLTIGRFEVEVSDLLGDSFAGVFIEHEPNYGVVVLTTDSNNEDTIASRATGDGLGDLVETRTVHRTLSSLEASLRASVVEAHELGVQIDGMVDVRNNVVLLRVLGSDYHMIHAGAGTIVQVVPQLLREEVTLEAGTAITLCTAGFTVQDDHSSTEGIVTASHCPNFQNFVVGGTTYNLPYHDETIGGSRDVQWNGGGTTNVRPWAADYNGNDGTPYYRVIDGQVARANQVVGAVVCKWGTSTQYTCGQIASKNSEPAAIVPNPLPTWIYVDGGSQNLSEGGDSGGPWYSGSLAYGVHHGGFGNDSVYMAINYITTLDVTLCTPANC
ncbi:MAG: hypothetical protein QOH61_1029 [Chloroflexota bacterium]|jgi:hypothetical protein|nr:hypothetical protein [Chloroflexota bacterium]